MSNRFHNKWHRRNHHTYGNPTNPDAGHDPIASQEQPFLGEFVLNGSLSAWAPLSAYAGGFFSNNTSICAIAGYRGLLVQAPRVGIEVRSNSLALSAYAERLGMSITSPGSLGRAISATAGFLGIDVYSPNIAISARGDNIAVAALSPLTFGRAISAYGGLVALEAYSPTKAISAFSTTVGAYIYSSLTGIQTDGRQVAGMFSSPTVSLSTGGGGYNEFNSRTGIYCIPTDKDVVGTPFSPVLAVKGNSYFDGSVTITGDLSTLGRMTYLDTKVVITSSLYVENKGTDAAATIIQTGAQPILVCYDKDESLATPSLIVDGNRQGYVGINTTDPVERLTINGNISGYNNQISLNQGKAVGEWATAFGNSRASGDFSLAEGYQTVASGNYAHAEGYQTVASGDEACATGFQTVASGNGSFSFGVRASATTESSFAGGQNSIVQDRYNGFAFGLANIASHDTSVSLGGNNNLASGPRATAFGGENNIASAYESHAEGARCGTGNRVPFESYNAATKTFTFTPEYSAIFFRDFVGNLQVTLRGCITGVNSFHDGTFFNVQVQPDSTAAKTPFNTLSALRVYYISGQYGTDITSNIGSGKGWLQNGSGWESHAEGYECVASGWRSSHAEGVQTLASGYNASHAEGYQTTASGQFGSHAEGQNTTAYGDSSHAEGYQTVAYGLYSHAEGRSTAAYGTNSHAAGTAAIALLNYSYAWADGNLGSMSSPQISSTRAGQYMVSATNGVFIPGKVGIGTDSLGNALTVVGDISAQGSIRLFGSLSASNPIYAGSGVYFGEGAIPDTNLYKSTANTLKTDDNFIIGVNGGKTTLQLSDTTANVGLTIGADTNLYRSTTDTLKTDDSLIVNSSLGVGTSPSVKLDVSNNATVPSVATGTTLHITQSDTTNNRVLLDSFGASSAARPAFTGRAANGTAASPTAVQADAVLCEFTAQGYGATTYSSTSRGRVTLKAAENWTDGAQGTYIGFENTAINSTTTSEVARIGSNGGLSATSISQTISCGPIFTSTTIGVNLNDAIYQIIPVALTNSIINFGGFAPGRTNFVLLSSIATTNLTIDPQPRNLIYMDGRPTTLPNTKVMLFEIKTFGASVSSIIVTTKTWP